MSVNELDKEKMNHQNEFDDQLQEEELDAEQSQELSPDQYRSQDQFQDEDDAQYDDLPPEDGLVEYDAGAQDEHQDEYDSESQDEYQGEYDAESQSEYQGEYDAEPQDEYQDEYDAEFQDEYQGPYEEQPQDGYEQPEQAQEQSPRQGMRPGMGQGRRPGMGQGQGQGMRPGMGQGQGQGMRPGMGQGQGQGMQKPQKRKETPTVMKYIKAMFARKIVIVGFVIFSIFALMAIFAPVIARYDPAAMDYTCMTAKPSAAHWLGTDEFGRDIFARLVYGARISLVIGVVAVFLAAIVGITLGMIGGYFGGVLDMVIQRVMEALNAIPNVMLSLALIAVLGNTVWDLGIVLSFVTIPSYVRMTRSMTMTQKNSDSVKAAQMAGGSSLYVMFKHILPNIMSPNIIMIMSNVGTTILLESALSFLGVGITIPTPSWGTMVADGRSYLLSNPYISIVPGLCVALLVISLNLLGDGIRDAMDPRLRGMH